MTPGVGASIAENTNKPKQPSKNFSFNQIVNEDSSEKFIEPLKSPSPDLNGANGFKRRQHSSDSEDFMHTHFDGEGVNEEDQRFDFFQKMNRKRLKNPQKAIKFLVKITQSYKEVNIMLSDEEREKRRNPFNRQTTASNMIDNLGFK